jgi:hypothetical protein
MRSICPIRLRARGGGKSGLADNRRDHGWGRIHFDSAFTASPATPLTFRFAAAIADWGSVAFAKDVRTTLRTEGPAKRITFTGLGVETHLTAGFVTDDEVPIDRLRKQMDRHRMIARRKLDSTARCALAVDPLGGYLYR